MFRQNPALFGIFLVFASACSASSNDTPATRGTAGSAGAANGGTAGLGSAGSSNAGGSGGVTALGGAAGTGAAGTGAAGAGGAGTNGGGTGGGAPNGGAAGSGSSPCGAAGLVLCDDFEARAAGAVPSGSPWAAQNCFDSGHVLKVDGTEAHSGKQSLVSQGIPYADCQVHADLGTLSDFYVRAWVYYAPGAADQFEAHEVTAFELVPAAGTDDPAIRVGFRGNTCLPEGVELNITGGMEQTGCTGVKPVAGVWTCYELHVQSGADGITADLSIDGKDQSFTNHGVPQEQVKNPDLKSVQYLRLGARSYSGSYAPLIYVDDVAVGTQPIGCK